MNITLKNNLIKKLRYKSNYRGCKETDLILGNFARQNLDKMSDLEMQEFAKILELNDSDIYDWYTHKKDVPKHINSALMQKILKFDPS